MPDLCSKYFRILLLPLLFYSCSGNHLITDREYLKGVETKFHERQILAERRSKELFSVFDRKLTTKQTEALEYLFAYMPLNDLADYSGEFFLANADKAIQAVSEVPWGKNIPEDIFLHYVLPYRINNENLDSFRIVCYDEIHKRISGKSMKDAALEINYWCNEKVNYQPADIRTSSPLNTMLSARGRCGEESTLTVAALRTAGIPARQVYTPRWAHVDDNHAWVEVWINGEWHYLGACEPEAVLDRGWFTEPARRAMLVHTKSFGASNGKENALNSYPDFTEVNVLSTYAATKKIHVKVLNARSRPVKGTVVEYCLYNYAEFYPLASVPADENGMSSFETGMGDLLVWARKDNDYAWQKISVSAADTIELILKKDERQDTVIDLDLNVPPVLSPFPGPSAETIRMNSEKVNRGNLIRMNFIATWIKDNEIRDIALKTGIDTSEAKNIFSRAMGNYNEIRKFLILTPDSLIGDAVSMLKILPDKDLRDTKAAILNDHLATASGNRHTSDHNEFYFSYVLNPRVSNELLTAWRSYLLKELPSYIKESVADPSVIIKFFDDSIRIADDENYYGAPLTPSGVYNLRVSDQASRAILFVAICRTLGIPSRLEPGREVPQYYTENRWHDVFFSDQKNHTSVSGFLKLVSSDTRPVPEYYNHFTIARFENGRYNTLNYDFAKKITGFNELELPAGKYMIVSGNRLPDSRILARLSFFDLKEDEHKTVEVNLRKDKDRTLVSAGKVDFAAISGLFPGRTIDISKGVLLFWIEPGKEPTRHIFSDLPLVTPELNEWGGNLIFLDGSSSCVPYNADIKSLPVNSLFGNDQGMNVFKSSVRLDDNINLPLPVVLYVNHEGNILFTSSGYRIGIGDQLLKIISKQ